MKRYMIYPTKEVGTYLKGDSYFIQIKIRDTLTNTLNSPSDVDISIKNPCGTEIISDVNMTESDTGIFTYDYDIDANAVYGKYDVTISTATYNQKQEFTFYVMPFDMNRDVRDLSGIGQNKSISDDSLNKLIWDSYKEVLHNIFDYHEYETPDYCRDVGDQCGIIDGTNTTFYTRHSNLADKDGDGSVLGYGESSCATDVDGIWKDSDTQCHQCKITVLDRECGKLTITQLDGSAIPDDAKGIYLKYYTQESNFKDYLFKDAVMYLAAHKVILRFGELERATSADLNSAQNIKYVDPKRMYKEYKRIIKLIRRPMIGGVQ